MTSRHIDPTTLASFAGAAAGHEGVLSDASGDLVIKPCTPAEVAFYEVVNASHPELAFYLPRFMGTLQFGDRRPAAVSLPANSASGTPQANTDVIEAHVINLPATHAPSTSIPPSEISPSASEVQSTPASSSSTSGTAATLSLADPGPLKGKKLDTDLHIVLENVSAGFTQPNILDLKLGARLWDEAAKPEKRARLDKVASETTSGSLGFRIAGMRVWQGEAKPVPPAPGVERLEDVVSGDREVKSQHWSIDKETNHKSYNKFYGRTFTADNVLQGFKEYFLVPSAGITEDHARIVLWNFLSELRDIEQILQSKESRMYSSSLLFVYEGNPEAFQRALDAITNAPVPKRKTNESNEEGEGDDDEGEEYDDDEEEDLPKVHAVKLIDFAHAKIEDGLGPDENMLAGVRSTIRILETLLKEISA
ncbi:uncharacterized protein PV09_09097 [Verruconis gallopava]|uniref:Kinase n=1 Tax=Verruconis gallopava TaxID=253628 RepID=A0A0D2AJV8_9PEZI|nr:uncharacterized protein PV09_09097 [Verruconis gallopava]KIV99233.1 hypothetical protein PV09_09097 [Verruconis gallopava]